jgi:preprotein translocase subunit SecF
MFVVRYRTLFFILSGLLMLLSIGAMIKFGFTVGIDFKGGTITQVSYQATSTNLVLAPKVTRPSQDPAVSRRSKIFS